jgi:hypothetical protein
MKNVNENAIGISERLLKETQGHVGVQRIVGLSKQIRPSFQSGVTSSTLEWAILSHRYPSQLDDGS